MPELASMNVTPDSLPLMLEQKLAAFKEFLLATIMLKEHILSEDMGRIDAAIGNRQDLIRRIDEIDNRITSRTTHPGTGRTGMIPGKERQIESLSIALEATITKVIAANKECTAISITRRDELERELVGIRNGRVALHGYAGGKGDDSSTRAPRFLSVNA